MDKKINARKKAQRLARQRKMRNRRIALTICLILAVSLVSVGGTIAWLTATTQKVENTFTVGNINIELKESGTNPVDGVDTKSYKMVPGNTLGKDPKVTVKAGSEACWVFVKIDESTSLDTYISYEVAEGWIALDATNYPGVYYREQGDLSVEGRADAVYSVLKNDQVTVNSGVTKAQMDALNEDKAVQPTLSFTAYAIQKANVTSAADAWTKLNVA